MRNVSTKYGILNNIERYANYENGQLESLCLASENKLSTSIGTLIPRFEDFTGRRKSTKCLSFYQNGNLKSIDLQEQIAVNTPIGSIDAELITFYENGAIKRIFPLNGAINGMWTEEDEKELVKPIDINLLNTDFKLNINSIYFYQNGAVKSISFFPGETELIPTKYGKIETRIGFSLSEDGQLLSLEPAAPYEIETPLGVLHAYDSSAIGLYADNNSLVFDKNNNVSEIVTSTNFIKLKDQSGSIHYLAPTFIESRISDEENELISLKIKFNTDSITFINQNEFTIKTTDIAEIRISSMPLYTDKCTDCEACGKCGSN